MKITTDNAVYVQKNDLGYLLSSDVPIPGIVYMKATRGENLLIDDRNRYEFIKFDQEEEINFFDKIDWMIEYNEVKDLSPDEMIELEQKILSKRNVIAQKYNEMPEEERKKRYDMVSQCELLDFKVHSLFDVFQFQQGKLSMKLPREIAKKENAKKFFKKKN